MNNLIASLSDNLPHFLFKEALFDIETNFFKNLSQMNPYLENLIFFKFMLIALTKKVTDFITYEFTWILL